MNSDVIEMKRPTKMGDFLDGLSEDDLLAALDEPQPAQQVRDIPAPQANLSGIGVSIPGTPLETNSRLTIIKMFERAPEYGQHFSFCVRRYTGEAYIQAMRTTFAKARKLAREQNFDTGEPFKMIVVDIKTMPTHDLVTVMRVPKGQKLHIKMAELARLMGGSSAQDDEDDDD